MNINNKAQQIELQEVSLVEKGVSAINVDISLFNKVSIVLQVCVGQVEMTIGELMDLKVNQSIKLNTSVNQDVELLLDGNIVAKGELVVVGDNFGIRLTEISVLAQKE